MQTQAISVLLVCISALSSRLAISEPDTAWYWPALIVLGYLFSTMMLMLLDSRTQWFSRVRDDIPILTGRALAVGLLLVVFPFADGAGRIVTAAHFRPLEQITIVALTNFSFFALAFPRIKRSESAAAGVSLVLLMAALMLGEHGAIVPLTVAYGSLCVAWLAARHWREMSTAARNGGAPRIPLLPVSCLVLLLVGVTAASSRVADGMPGIWGEWVPSSGGSRWANPGALLGVGDGDWMVSGPNAKHTGPIDSDHFLESDLPTMYDVMMEAYGEPRPPEELRRAIFVRQEKMLAQQMHKAPDQGEAGRQFSLYRKGRSQPPERDSENATALLYVEGNTPLHLSMNVYERFDGINWQEPPKQQAVCSLEAKDADMSWLWLPIRQANEIYGGTRAHKVRFGRLTSDRLPAPNHLERIRLGKHGGESVGRWARDVFRWAHEGILSIRQCLPQGTYLEFASHVVDQEALLQVDALAGGITTDGAYLDVPEHLRVSAEAFAQRFAHVQRGGVQINAVLNHLRTHYEHDRDATVPPTCEDPVHHFLHQARSGPAYQFATAAALVLRSLGYPTRVVSGFYASPAHFVARTGNTPIRAEDAHVWIEVRIGAGHWITFDPTPGYQTEWYRASVFDQMKALAMAVTYPLIRSPIKSSIVLVLVVGLWWQRLRARERLLTCLCLWWPPRNSKERLIATLRLMDLRCRLCGFSRPTSMTPLAWYGRVVESDCHGFMRYLYRAIYGHDETAQCVADVTRSCRAVLHATAISKMRNRLSSV